MNKAQLNYVNGIAGHELIEYLISKHDLRQSAKEAGAPVIFSIMMLERVIQYGTDILAEHRFENAEPKTLSEFYYMIGNAYFEQENYPKAIEYDQKALQLNEDHAELYRDLAISLARSGNVAKAQELLQKAEGRSLSTDTLTIAQAEISLAQQHYTEAAAAFEKAVASAYSIMVK